MGRIPIQRVSLRAGLLAAFSLVFMVASACSGRTGQTNVAPEVGSRAPSFEAQFVGGDTSGIDDLLGDGIVLNFWATWCGPCRRELPLLDQTAREVAQDGVKIIAVNMGESEEEILLFLDDFNVSFPIALDADGSIARLYAVPALPMTFFIDSSGVIQYRRVGELLERHIAEGLSRIAKST